MDKPKVKFTTVDEYIGSVPDSVAEKLQTIRQIVKELVPQAEEKISYQIPSYKLNGLLLSFGAWKKYISMYPLTAEMEASIEGVSAYKTSGKGTVQFPLDQPLPLPLIRNIVALRFNVTLKE